MLSLTAVLGLATCSASGTDVPARLTVGIGFESVTDPDLDWEEIRERFDTAGVDGFSISVGRPEWIGFAWEGHEDDWAPRIAAADEKGNDPVGDAIAALTAGTDRTVTLTIDVLSPATIADEPELGGAFADGTAAPDFPSAAALHTGPVGERVVELCAAAAQRYRPDRVAITELIGDTFFSEVDEELYAGMTGEDGFPRTRGGEVDVTDSRVADWQSEIITGLLARCSEAAGMEVEMDARVNWANPGTDRAESGHRYADIYGSGAHLTLWAYTGIAGVEPERTGELAAAMKERYSADELARTTLSVGLWDRGDEVLGPAELTSAVRAAASVDGGPPAILVTPLSLMTDEHWEALTNLAGTAGRDSDQRR